MKKLTKKDLTKIKGGDGATLVLSPGCGVWMMPNIIGYLKSQSNPGRGAVLVVMTGESCS